MQRLCPSEAFLQADGDKARENVGGTPDEVIAELRVVLETCRPSILILWGHDGGVERPEDTFDEEVCRAGTLIKLPHLATFGPIKVGDQGAEILEIYFGDSRPAPADKAEYAALLEERGITELPHPPVDLPDWFGPRTD